MSIKAKLLKEIQERGLDMAHDARMARAKEQGFDTDTVYYHGTGADFDGFKNKQERDYGYSGQGYYFTDDPFNANFYASTTEKKGGNPNVIPAYLRMKKPYIIKEYTDQPRGMQAGQSPEFTESLKDQGYDGVITKMLDRDMSTGEIVDEYIEEVVSFDPKNIRSTNAAFDPAKKDSSNLLASLGAGTLAGGAALGSQDAEAGVITKGGKKVIDAWHGSPHDFDKFQMSQIGTGEGAQAFGHGLYFADAKDTAKSYQEALSGELSKLMDARWSDDPVGVMASDILTARRSKIDEGEVLKDTMRIWGYEGDKDELVKEAYKRLDEVESAGSLYNVNIDATPDELLDWDKPLREQPNLLKSIQENEYFDPIGEGWANTSMKGEDFYNSLAKNVSDSSKPEYDSASSVLDHYGVKGIQYNDAMSRGSEGGTKNYVIFDDNLVSIAKKYGVSLPVASAIASGAISPQDAQAANTVNQPKTTAMQTLYDNQKPLQTIQAPNSQVLANIANVLKEGERRVQGSPAEFIYPSSLGDWAEKAAYGEADWGDRIWATLDLMP